MNISLNVRATTGIGIRVFGGSGTRSASIRRQIVHLLAGLERQKDELGPLRMS
jgi:hypothetical protein